jgi:hypothetical protein
MGDFVKYQVVLSETKVNEIKEDSGIKKNKELFNFALSLLEWSLKEKQKGRIIVSLDEENQKYKEILIPANHIPKEIK